MNPHPVVVYGIYIYLCIIAAAMLIAPNIRRGIRFGVAVTPEFRGSAGARSAIRRFRSVILIVLAVCLAAVGLAPGVITAVAAPGALIAASVTAFIFEHRRLLRVASAPPSRQREVELSTAPDRLPGWIWLNAGPFLILLAAAFMLNAHWRDIPVRFPVHWGLGGEPNRWRPRTFWGVYGPLFLGAELCAWILVLALATWFGARRSPVRRSAFAALTWIEYMLAIEFALIGIMPLGYFGPPRAAIILAPLVFLIPALIVLFRGFRNASAPADRTPNECWKGGMIYYNPDDPALLVEKRAGLGYTFNFGNRWSWVLALVLALIVGTAPLIV